MPSRSTTGGTQSARKPLNVEAEAQQVLKELWDEQLIPFVLNVGKIVKDVSGEYTIHFHDSRIHSARFFVSEGHSFREMVRTAVLDRVAKISGPLLKTHNP